MLKNRKNYPISDATEYFALVAVFSGTVPLSIIFAVIVYEIRNEKFKKVTQTIVYAPHFVSLVILVTMLGLFFDTKGIVNNLLTSTGI